MRDLHITLSLQSQRCAVIGEGSVPEHYAERLTRHGARVDRARDLASAESLQGRILVIAATGSAAHDRQIADACAALGIPCYADADGVDASADLPATLERGPMTLAISISGASRTLVDALRNHLGAWLPTLCSSLLSIAINRAPALVSRLPEASHGRFWRKWINLPVGNPGPDVDEADLNQRFDRLLDAVAGTASPQAPASAAGHVALIGAGPGDPELLTQRALRVLHTADVVVYDRLVSQAIMALVPTEARLIYAGKAKANHAIPQDSINQLLVDLAAEGNEVVRLKGGDPFIFGRGGEEIETLTEHGIDFQVIPGITAASGCSAFSGIPLTHRDHAQSVVFVTGHLRDGNINLNWQELRDPAQTIVVYMGLSGLTEICNKLIEHGRAADTPAALVERGTTPRQRVLVGTLATLPARVAEAGAEAPTLLIIGSVVSLRDKLAWFHPTLPSD